MGFFRNALVRRHMFVVRNGSKCRTRVYRKLQRFSWEHSGVDTAQGITCREVDELKMGSIEIGHEELDGLMWLRAVPHYRIL